MAHERGSKSNARPEILERSMPGDELVKRWGSAVVELEKALEDLSSTSKCVDIIRSSGLRWAHAKQVGLAEWAYRWQILKHRALIASLERKREGDSNIKIGAYENKYGVHIMFQFAGGTNVFRTSTLFRNLELRVPSQDLLDLVDPFRANEQGEQKVFDIVQLPSEVLRGLIFHRGFNEGIVINDFAWLRFGEKSGNSFKLKIAALKEDVIASSVEVHELQLDHTYRFGGTQYKFHPFDNDSGRTSIVLDIPRQIEIVREEISPFRVFTA